MLPDEIRNSVLQTLLINREKTLSTQSVCSPNWQDRGNNYYSKQYIIFILQMKTWNMQRAKGLVFNTAVYAFHSCEFIWGQAWLFVYWITIPAPRFTHSQPCLHLITVQYLFISCFFQKNYLPLWTRILPSNPVTCSPWGRTGSWTQASHPWMVTQTQGHFSLWQVVVTKWQCNGDSG